VDSVVMLHKLVRSGEADLVVVHLDHGIRTESGADARFVEGLARHYNVPFVSVQLHLGSHASEELARQKRWEFLRHVKDEYQADAILTAHHDDDVVETIIMNLMRGTGWRGLVSLIETIDIKRPLLGMRKADILGYAHEHKLTWQEDATNADENYRRNFVRRQIMPKVSDEQFARFLRLYDSQKKLRQAIEADVADINTGDRYQFIMWPDAVAYEYLRRLIGSLPRPELSRALLFIRTARANREMPLSNGVKLRTDASKLIVIRGED